MIKPARQMIIDERKHWCPRGGDNRNFEFDHSHRPAAERMGKHTSETGLNAGMVGGVYPSGTPPPDCCHGKHCAAAFAMGNDSESGRKAVTDTT
jgi:hypothetical protein